MSLFKTPAWVDRHTYETSLFSDLSAAQIADLQVRLSKFNSEEPEVSVVIPAWNEENNIYRSLSSLADSNTKFKVEIIVINNNSTDNTQAVLDQLGVKSFLEPNQGTAYARQLGLTKAKGKYHLCADSDTYYPASWIDLMVKPMMVEDNVVGVYGRYSFMPLPGSGRFPLRIYEMITSVLVRVRQRNREYMNVLGFNMGFITEVGIANGGFSVEKTRKFDNRLGSEDFVDEAEDGRMAINLMKTGRLKLVTDPYARVFTSSRRLLAEGGIYTSLKNRIKLHSKRLREYSFNTTGSNS